jgi:hypothetical protein
LFGVFLLGSGRPVVERVSRIFAFLILVASALIYVRYPGTLSFTAGFVGLFSGIGLRAIWYVNFQAEYVHCSVCGTNVWATKKKNGVFCNKGHLISSLEPNRAG